MFFVLSLVQHIKVFFLLKRLRHFFFHLTFFDEHVNICIVIAYIRANATLLNATLLIYSIFLITTMMKINTVATQTTKVTLKLMKVRLMRYLRKGGNNSKWSATKPKSERRSACDVVKGTPGPRLDVRLVKSELEAFLLHINENMITEMVERTNNQMCKVRKKLNADEFLFATAIQTKKKLNVYLDCFV